MGGHEIPPASYEVPGAFPIFCLPFNFPEVSSFPLGQKFHSQELRLLGRANKLVVLCEPSLFTVYSPLWLPGKTEQSLKMD